MTAQVLRQFEWQLLARDQLYFSYDGQLYWGQLQSFLLNDSPLHAAGRRDDVGVDGVVDVGPEGPGHQVSTGVRQSRGAIAKGPARFRLNWYFSNFTLYRDGRYISIFIIMKTNKNQKPKPSVAVAQPASAPRKRQDEEVSDELSIQSFWGYYSSSTDTHTKLIDLFIVYLLVLVGCQLFYRFTVGDDFPRNAFVSGIFCPLGVMVLLVILRARGRDLRQLAEFFLACIVLFITAINFAG